MHATTVPSVQSSVVRTRSAIGDSSFKLERFVLCSVRGITVPLPQCATCLSCRGFGAGPHAEIASVVCSSGESFFSSDAAAAVVPSSDEGAVDANHTAVSEIMSKHVACVHSNLSLAALDDLLGRLGVAGAPVVNDSFEPVGVVSRTDLQRSSHERPGSATPTVGDIMTPLVFSLRVNASIARAAALMAFERVHRIPVIDADGRVVGILSTLDVLQWLAGQGGYVVAPR